MQVPRIVWLGWVVFALNWLAANSAVAQPGVPLEEVKLDNLLRGLSDTDDNAASGFVQEIGQLELPVERRVSALVGILDHPADSARWTALNQLRELGVKARPAVPRILRLIRESSQLGEPDCGAITALGPIAEPTTEVVDALVAVVRDARDDATGRRVAMDVLGGWGTASRVAAPLLEGLQDHKSIEVQMHAFEALGRIKAARQPTAAELRMIDFAALPPAQAFVALEALRTLGPQAKFAVAPLQAWYARPDTRASTKLKILETLPAIDGCDGWHVKTAFAALRHYDRGANHSSEATYLLDGLIRRLDGKRTDAALALVAELDDPSVARRELVAAALAKYGEKALPADAALARILAQVNRETNRRAVGSYLEAIRAMGPNARHSRQALVDFLRSPVAAAIEGPATEVRSYVFAILADGPTPPEILPDVLAALEDPSQAWLCAAAARAAGSLGPAAADATPQLVSLLRTGRSAQVSLDRFGAGRRFGRDRSFTSSRLEAIRALERIGPAASSALPILRELADYPSLVATEAALRASGHGIDSRFEYARREAAAVAAALKAIDPKVAPR